MQQVTCSLRPPTLSQHHMNVCVCDHTHDLVIYSKFQNPFVGIGDMGLTFFGHSHYFGCWLLQQLVLYKP